MSGGRRTALVTGASRGLGLEVARLLAASGYGVTVVGRDADTLDHALRSLDGDGHEAAALDLSTPADTRTLAERIARTPFDVVVNNAGGTRFGPVTSLSGEEVERIAWLNFTAPVLLSRAFVAAARRGAVLVNVTSAVATVPMPGNTLYSATKAGLRWLTDGLRYEAAGSGVRVLEFRPVTLRTRFHEHAGGASLAGDGTGVDPADAARQLVAMVERGRRAVGGMGTPGRVLDAMTRLLPRGWLVGMLGRRASRSGYLAGAAGEDAAR